MNIRYLGHSCFLLDINGHQVLLDPFISVNPLAKGKIKLEDIKPDYILLTHGHGDHVGDVEGLALANGALVIGNFEVTNWFADKSCRVMALNIGGKHKFIFGEVRMLSAVHSSTMPDGSDGGMPNGYLIKTTTSTVYIAGDTGLSMEMTLIPKYYGRPNMSILPIGDTFTMGYEDAIIAAGLVECNKVVGCHFDTFPPIVIDHDVVKKAFEDKGIELILPSINQIFSI